MNTRETKITRALEMATETRDHHPTHSTMIVQEPDGRWLAKIAEYGSGDVFEVHADTYAEAAQGILLHIRPEPVDE